MSKSSKKFNINIVVFLCLFAICFGKIVRYGVMKETLVLPGIGWGMLERVNNDIYKFGLTIKDSDNDSTVSNATANAGFIFSKLNVFHLVNSYYGYEILISIVWNIIILLMIVSLKKSYYLWEMLFALASVAVLNIFDFCLAKEPIQMLYFILMYFILKSNKDKKFKFGACFGVYILSSITYRNYYILMAMFFIYIFLVYKFIISKIKKIEFKHIILILLLTYLCYFMILNVVKIVTPSNFIELLRVRLRSSTAASDMRAIFKTNNLAVFTLDYLIMLIRMMLPVELIKLGPKYAVYTLYQVMITIILIKSLKNINKISDSRKIALYVYMSFLMGSAAFEPDFGSWIRHEAVLFPIFIIISGFNEKGEKETNSNEKNHI